MTPPSRPAPGSALRPDFAWIDLEASSLHEGSFPVEVGICDDALVTRSWLVRPDPAWGRAAWSVQSQAIHGLSWERLMEEGRPASEVAGELDDALSGKLLFSDAKDFDAHWLKVLYEAAGRPMPLVLRDEAEALLRQVQPRTSADLARLRAAWAAGEDLAERVYPHTHWAADDAMCMAASFRMAVDPAFMARVEALDAANGRRPGLYGRGDR